MDTVIFFPARNGGVMTRYLDKIAFPERRGVQPKDGDEYEVLSSSPNPSGTILSLKLGRCIPKQRVGDVLNVIQAAYSYDKEIWQKETGGIYNHRFLTSWENPIEAGYGDLVEVEIISCEPAYENGYSHSYAKPVRIVEYVCPRYGGWTHDALMKIVSQKVDLYPGLRSSKIFSKESKEAFAGMSRDEILIEIESLIQDEYKRVLDLPPILMRDDVRLNRYGYLYCLHYAAAGSSEWLVTARRNVKLEQVHAYLAERGMNTDVERVSTYGGVEGDGDMWNSSGGDRQR